MARYVKICCLVMCFLLALISPVSIKPFDTVVSAAAATQGYVNGTNVNIRSGAGTSYSSLGKLSNVYVTVNSSTVGSDEKTWYNVTTADGITGYMHGDYIKIISSPSADQTFEGQLEQFPESYKASLRELHSLYPNWKFVADKVSMSYDTAVLNEFGKKTVNLSADGISWRSMGEGNYNWSTGAYTNVEGGWTAAAKQVVAYYMDVRNFLNGNDIYMFLSQGYIEGIHTEEGVKKIIAGTFLEGGYSDAADTDYGGSYVKVIMEAAKQSGVSPYILASTIIQEQGVSGTSGLISGNTSYGTYYNFFNFGATGDNVIANGLNYAKNQGWTTRSASIIGGAKLYGGNYTAKGQDTYFYKNFNISSNAVNTHYTHQYSSNVYDSKSSAGRLKGQYIEDYAAELVFRIPVYTSIPDVLAANPKENDKKNNYYITSMSIAGLSPEFYMYTQSYSFSVSGETTVEINLPSGASLASPGAVNLNAGLNSVDLIICAETGYLNTYNLAVTAQSPCMLKISVNGVAPEPDTSTPSTPSTPSSKMNGDVNSDGVIDGIDLAAIKMHLLDIRKLTGNMLLYADVNKDNVIDGIDLAAVKMHLLGIRIIPQ